MLLNFRYGSDSTADYGVVGCFPHSSWYVHQPRASNPCVKEVWTIEPSLIFTFAATLHDRASSDCTAGQYTSPDGLTFEKHCGQDISGGYESWYNGNNLQECMDACSTARPPCYGVAFSEGYCYAKNETDALSEYLVDRTDVDSALADATQLKTFDSTCPHNTLSYQNTTTGMEFQILCDRDGGNDYCPTNSEGQRTPGGWADFIDGCPTHTDSLDECMLLCSQAQPLCEGVSWNPGMESGFANCYFKTNWVCSMNAHFVLRTTKTRANWV